MTAGAPTLGGLRRLNTVTFQNLVVTGTLTASSSETIAGATTITASSANALAVGRQGATAPALLVSTNASSSATGLSIVSAAAASGVAVAAISSGTDENLTINAKGAGTVSINGTATGGITLGRAVTLSSTINKLTLTAPATAATLSLVDGTTVTGPAATGTLATLAGSETLTNKTLTSPVLNTPTISGAISTGTVRTTSAVTKNANTTYANVTGLSQTVVTGGTYAFRLVLPSTVASGTGGIKYAFNYTTTVLASIQASAAGYTASAVAVQNSTSTTTQADLFTQAAVVIRTEIDGTFVVTTGGTIDVQMAQNTSNGSDTVALVGGSFQLIRLS